MWLRRRLRVGLTTLLVVAVGVWPALSPADETKKPTKTEAPPPAKAPAKTTAPSQAQIEKNRQRLATMRKDPEHYARLLRDLQAFMNLPPDQQDRLRQLDDELQKMDEAQAAKLHRALLRYADWLERLPESRRQYIETAPDGKERLRRIKELREKEWIERLPQGKRDQIQQAQGKDRRKLINKFRQEEKQAKQKWDKPLKHWDELQRGFTPMRASELPPEANPAAVQAFVEKVLLPRLSRPDLERLNKAEGHWPNYPETLVQLADKYVPFPGPVGPRTLRDLPPELQRRIGANVKPGSPRANMLSSFEGRWPDYAILTATIAKNQKINLPPRTYPAKPADFGEAIQLFLRNQLIPELSQEERRQLHSAEGKWPNYPQTLVELARKHNLHVPGMLPGSWTYWDKYRPPKQAANK